MLTTFKVCDSLRFSYDSLRFCKETPRVSRLPLSLREAAIFVQNFQGNMAPLGLLLKSWALCWALIFSHACGQVQRSEIGEWKVEGDFLGGSTWKG